MKKKENKWTTRKDKGVREGKKCYRGVGKMEVKKRIIGYWKLNLRWKEGKGREGGW